MNHVFDRLTAACSRKQSRVCVGLDPHLPLLPESLSDLQPVEACRRFLFDILEAVADVVPAVKPQIAFFEQLGAPGVQLYFDLVREAHRHDLFVVGDIKRADIGSTAAAYARAHLQAGDGSAADAVTLNPYLGKDSIQPFLEVGREVGRGVFVLVRTSNKTRSDFQDLRIQGTKKEDTLYLKVGSALEAWGAEHRGQSGYSDIGAVVGATGPDEAAHLRAALPHTFFLVPGYGAQGGTATDVARTFDASGGGALISSSRGILFAYREATDGPGSFVAAARLAAQQMSQEIEEALTAVRPTATGS
jgi:orotidine-5'-phosphate decarboxylase